MDKTVEIMEEKVVQEENEETATSLPAECTMDESIIECDENVIESVKIKYASAAEAVGKLCKKMIYFKEKSDVDEKALNDKIKFFYQQIVNLKTNAETFKNQNKSLNEQVEHCKQQLQSFDDHLTQQQKPKMKELCQYGQKLICQEIEIKTDYLNLVKEGATMEKRIEKMRRRFNDWVDFKKRDDDEKKKRREQIQRMNEKLREEIRNDDKLLVECQDEYEVTVNRNKLLTDEANDGLESLNMKNKAIRDVNDKIHQNQVESMKTNFSYEQTVLRLNKLGLKKQQVEENYNNLFIECEKSNEELKIVNESLNNDLESIEDEKEKTEAELKEIATKISQHLPQIQSKHDSLQVDVANLCTSFINKQFELNAAMLKHIEKEKEKQELQMKLKDLQIKKLMKQKYEHLKGTFEWLQSDEKRIVENEEKLSKLLEKNDELQVTNNDLKEKYAVTEMRYNEAKKKYMINIEKVRKLKTELNRKRIKISGLKRQLELPMGILKKPRLPKCESPMRVMFTDLISSDTEDEKKNN